MTEEPSRWSQPFAALLGAYEAQLGFGLPSIGGKDSMSGTFEDIDVPPTLCSFAVDVAKQDDIITPELKKAGNTLIRFDIEKNDYDMPVFEQIKMLYSAIHQLIGDGVIKSAYVLDGNGLIPALSKMAFGNKLGLQLYMNYPNEFWFEPRYGTIIAEVSEADLSNLAAEKLSYEKLAIILKTPEIQHGSDKISIEEMLTAWTSTLEKVFPTKSDVEKEEIETKLYNAKTVYTAGNKIARPKVFIPVFPGTNCEYDTMISFEAAGAEVETIVFRNMSETDIRDSVDAYVKAIKNSQMIMFPGGFSAGDEPEGSAKFIASVFRNPKIKEATNDLLKQKDGLILGICNGFQALIKLGLVPYGEITNMKGDTPTLTTNSIGRHISKSVYTKIVSNKSPWLAKAGLGNVYSIPASHGEGRFVASKEWLDKLFEQGQVATQYVDTEGNPTMDEDFNPNGSYYAIEGILSPDGRVLGKMAHSERRGNGVAMNIFGDQNQHIFEAGVEYFK